MAKETSIVETVEAKLVATQNDTKDDKEKPKSRVEFIEDKKEGLEVRTESIDSADEPDKEHVKSVSTARDLVTEILLVEDDATQNPWTFRMWFIGLGMSVFAG